MELELWASISIWLSILIFAAVIELQTDDYITLFIIAGCIAALSGSFITNNAMIQLAIFGVTTIGLSVTLLPFIGFKRKGVHWDATAERLLNKVTKVIKYNEETKTFSVKSDGVLWDVVSSDKVSLHDEVKILKIEGNKLRVSVENGAWTDKLKKGDK